ncbi:hypothetical protein AAF712_013757 [Marasmius tenuissimus]|uniref:Uncharacterized protein n=1 Tax=Marasmius tenuissimus TaxID=585030 RepID=A0ABR2ZCU3_9AGAR
MSLDEQPSYGLSNEVIRPEWPPMAAGLSGSQSISARTSPAPDSSRLSTPSRPPGPDSVESTIQV